jgi:hypothetical protein
MKVNLGGVLKDTAFSSFGYSTGGIAIPFFMSRHPVKRHGDMRFQGISPPPWWRNAETLSPVAGY